MKRTLIYLLIAVICSNCIGKIDLVTLPERSGSQLTIYNSADLTLVREHRNLTLKKGYNWLQLSWSNTLIDPTSLTLEPLSQADKVEIRQLLFPARTRQLGQWLIYSQIDGQVPFEVTYFTSGLSWRAFYMGTLAEDEKTMGLKGYVRVTNNSGEDYENAQTRLIVGQVHILDQIAALANRQYPYGSPVPVPSSQPAGVAGSPMNGRQWGMQLSYASKADVGGAADMLGRLRPKEIKKEGLSEYFLYTIEGTETIPNTWAKRLQSFEANDIKIESLYKYDEERWGNQTIRFVKFTNDKDHNLGQTPLPNGDMKIYGLADSEGHLSYIGGATVKYIPVNEEVELDLGPARLVSVELKVMEFKAENFMFDQNKDVCGWDEVRDWQIKITNTTQLPVQIEVTRAFSTSYWDLRVIEGAGPADKLVDYKKHDATHARFKVELAPRSKRTFCYTLRTYHGVREDQANRQ
jgi:hypothetical protein